MPPRFSLRATAAIASVCVLGLLVARWGSPERPPATTAAAATPLTDSPPPVAPVSTAPAPAGKNAPASPPTASPAPFSPLLARVGPDPSTSFPDDLPASAAAFRAWAEAYRQTQPAARTPDLLARGVTLAQAQRETLRALIPADPRLALAAAAPVALRQDLPPEVDAALETRVQAEAFYGVLATPPPGEGDTAPAIRREVRFGDGQRYDAYVYGDRQSQRTTPRALVHGVAVDAALAVSVDRVRRLEAGERPNPAKPQFTTCPVSGQDAPAPASGAAVTDATPAYETPTAVHYLCSGGHLVNVEEAARQRETTGDDHPPTAGEGSTGGPSKPTGAIPGAYATGVKSVLYIRATFPDQNADPQSEKDAAEMMRGVSEFFIENSYGRLYLQTTVTPLLVLPRTEAAYRAETGGDFALLQDARTAAKAAGYDYLAFDQEAVRYAGGPGGFAGQAYVGGRGTWLKSSGVGVAAHEFGHNFGLWHANYWNTTPPSVTGPGANNEYGDSFDTMGAAGAGNQHFNANHKSLLSWLTDDLSTTVRANGLYRIYAMDQPVADPAKRYALKVVRDSDRDYWLEYRGRYAASNAWARDGAFLHWSAWGDDGASGSSNGSQLLDATPGSPDGKTDAPLVIGRTFSDPAADLHFTPVAKGGTTPESIEIVVNRGPFPGNQAPTASLGASAASANVGAALTFTAAASDPDGDALAYAWDFGDKTWGANAAAVTKSWPAAGRYNVRCTVSDMKGRAATVQTLITVGTATNYLVQGRVTDTGGIPLPEARVDNGQTGAAYRGALTDSAGNYTITNVAAGPATIRAAHPDHTFAATQAVNVSADLAGVDFSAALLPTVTFSAPDATAVESGGDTAALRLTRTGAITSALTVWLLAPNGTAFSGSDYSLAPGLVYSAGVYTLTIPAGAAALDVTLTAVNDATAEGPEGANFYLLPTTAYRVAGPQSVSVTINDDDSTLSRVGVAPLDDAASEAGDPASFILRCLPAPTAPLNVSLIYGGTASNGSDLSALPTVITIPAGQTSVTVPVTALDDNEAEGNETLTVTVATSAGYLRASEALTATLLILDDDLNVITVAATDNAAGEANADPGTFTLTRAGNPARELAVDYTIGGTALHGKDYQRLPGRVTFPAGVASVTLLVQPIDDAVGEPTQTIVLQLRAQPGYLVGSPGLSATINLTDNDQPAFTVAPMDGIATEPAGGATATDTARFRIHRTGSGAVTVNFALSGSADAGVDYTASPGGSIAFAAGDAFKEITVTPLADATAPTPEDAETVTLTLTPGPGYRVEPEATATVRILDNQPMVSVSPKSSIASTAETATAAVFYVSRTGATTAALTVNYAMTGTATNGADYATLPGTATIPAGAGGVDITLVPINDTLTEGAETAVLTLQPSDGYGLNVRAAQFLITDNDGVMPQNIAFAAPASDAPENAGTARLTVRLSAAAAGPVSVGYAVTGGPATGGGVDYRLTSGTLTFPAGTVTQDIVVSIVDDEFPEDAETLTVTLREALGAALLGGVSHVVTIRDDDSAPLPTAGFATAASSALENIAAPNTVVITLDRAASQTVTVNYAVTGGSATAGDDYHTPGGVGALTFLPGEVAKPVPLTLLNDTAVENDETVAFALGSLTNATLNAAASTHTFTLGDDDLPTVSILASDARAGEFGADPGAWTVSRTGSTAAALTVGLQREGTATFGDDYALAPALGGSSAITLPAGATSATITLTPVADALAEGAETATFTILPGNGYVPGAAPAATVNLADRPMDDWRFRKLGATDANNPALAADNVDLDGDGWSNLAEYAFGGDPRRPDARAFPAALTAGAMTLSYPRAEEATDVTVSAAWSDDLAGWSTAGIADTAIGEPVGGMTPRRAVLPVAGDTGHRFMRLQIQR